jgi:hypothetical protein
LVEDVVVSGYFQNSNETDLEKKENLNLLAM